MVAKINKKKSFRKEYLNDFRPDEAGRYSYKGKMKTLGEAGVLARRRVRILGVVSFLFVIAAGFLTGRDLGGKVYALLPYLLAMGSLGLALYGAFSLGFSGEVREYLWKRAMAQISGGAAVGFFASLAAAAGGLVSIALAPGTEALQKAGFALAMAVAAGAAGVMRKNARALASIGDC